MTYSVAAFFTRRFYNQLRSRTRIPPRVVDKETEARGKNKETEAGCFASPYITASSHALSALRVSVGDQRAEGRLERFARDCSRGLDSILQVHTFFLRMGSLSLRGHGPSGMLPGVRGTGGHRTAGQRDGVEEYPSLPTRETSDSKPQLRPSGCCSLLLSPVIWKHKPNPGLHSFLGLQLFSGPRGYWEEQSPI